MSVLKLVRARFPQWVTSLGMVTRWTRQAQVQSWDDLPQHAASRCKEVPNWFKAAKQIGGQKGNREESFVPAPILRCYDHVLVSRIHGMDPNNPVNESLTSRDVIIGMTQVITDYNKKVETANHEILRGNLELWESVRRGDISFTDAKTRFRHTVKRATGKPSKMWLKRFRKVWSWSHRSLSAAGNYLPYAHPKMQKFRDRVHAMVETLGVRPQPVLNYDQVYRMMQRGHAKKYYKQKIWQA